MIFIGSYEAKTHLSRLLGQVERGETITITKRGKPIAVLSPAQPPPPDVRTVIEEMIALREQQGLVSGEALAMLRTIEEGRP